MRIWGMIAVTLAATGVILTACESESLAYSVEDLPTGDPARGAEAFVGAAGCSGCHRLVGGKSTGPSLDGYGDAAGGRVEGQSPEEYTFYSILRPAKHIVQGYSNVMPSDYDDRLSREVLADLIAYLLTL